MNNVKNPLPMFTLQVYKGLPFVQRFLTEGLNGLAINNLGKKVRCQLRAKLGDAVVLYEFSTANGKIAAGNGFIELNGMTAAETAAFTWDDAIGDVVIEEQANVYMPLFRCRFVVVPTTTGVPQ